MVKNSAISMFVLLSFLSASACVAPQKFRHEAQAPVTGANMSAGMGDDFYRQELMYGEDNGFGTIFNGEATMFVLTVVALNEKALSLQYTEYIKQMHGPSRGFRPDSPWMIKDKFSQRYDYELTSKTIRFKTLEFETLGVADGRIDYRRTK